MTTRSTQGPYTCTSFHGHDDDDDDDDDDHHGDHDDKEKDTWLIQLS